MRDRLGKCDGGMAAFSANSGGGGLHFRVCHGREPKSFTAAVQVFDDQDARILVTCKGELNEYGIVVWEYGTLPAASRLTSFTSRPDAMPPTRSWWPRCSQDRQLLDQ